MLSKLSLLEFMVVSFDLEVAIVRAVGRRCVLLINQTGARKGKLVSYIAMLVNLSGRAVYTGF